MTVQRLSDMNHLLMRIQAIDPDVILIDPGESLARTRSSRCSRSAARCAARSRCSWTRATRRRFPGSIDAGVSAYIVDGLKKERVKSILDLCISRFNAFSRLQSELERAKTDLEDRKSLDRAKGILMKNKGLTEDEAYRLMRGAAMRDNKKIADIARAMVTAAELLK